MKLLRFVLLFVFAAKLSAAPVAVTADTTTKVLAFPTAAQFRAANDILAASTAATTYQPLSANLTALAGQASTDYGRATLNLSDAIAARVYFGVRIGQDVQAWAANLDAWALLAPATKADTSAFDAHVARTDNPHAVTKAQVGLALADNTADIDKPVSTAQAAADAAALASANAHTDAHAARTDNPHSVTKSQVGLGTVTNDPQTKAAIVPNTAPAAGQIPVGNAGGTAYSPASVSGDATLASSGALTLATVNATPSTYGDASHAVTVSVDAKGRATSVSSQSISIAPSQINAPIPNGSLANSSVTIGTTTIALGATVTTLTGIADPVNATDVVNKRTLDAYVYGLDWKQSVRVATTANITLSGTQTIDGVALVVGDRVLVKNQTDATQNGIYVVASGAWTRTPDGGQGQITTGISVYVSEGTLSGKCAFALITPDPITVGTSPLTFVQVTGPNLYVAGTGINIAGNSISTANVPNAALANSAITLAGTSTPLGGSITLDTFDGLAANGIVARTAANTRAVRAITGTANQVNVANGDGVAGNPTLSLPQNIHTGATPTFASLTISGTSQGQKLRAVNNSQSIELADFSSNYTAGTAAPYISLFSGSDSSTSGARIVGDTWYAGDAGVGLKIQTRTGAGALQDVIAWPKGTNNTIASGNFTASGGTIDLGANNGYWISSELRGRTGGTFTVGTGGDFDLLLKRNGSTGVTVGLNGTTVSGYLTVNGDGVSTVGATRPLTINPATGIVSVKGSAGGWDMRYGFIGSAGTAKGGFGATGDTDALSYFYVGPSYSSTYAQFSSTSTTLAGNLGVLGASGVALGGPATSQWQTSGGNTYLDAAAVGGGNLNLRSLGGTVAIQPGGGATTIGGDVSIGTSAVNRSLYLVSNSGGSRVLDARYGTDTNGRLLIRGDGRLFWGDGAGTFDSYIERAGANLLAFGASLRIAAPASAQALEIRQPTDGVAWLSLRDGAGTNEIGQVYRVAASNVIAFENKQASNNGFSFLGGPVTFNDAVTVTGAAKELRLNSTTADSGWVTFYGSSARKGYIQWLSGTGNLTYKADSGAHSFIGNVLMNGTTSHLYQSSGTTASPAVDAVFVDSTKASGLYIANQYTDNLASWPVLRYSNAGGTVADALAFSSTGVATFSGPVKFPSYTVGTLPSASTSGAGATAYATDLTSTTSGATAAGGGSGKHLVTSDGANWIVQ